MPDEDQRSSVVDGNASRRILLSGALIASALVGIALFAIARDDKPAATSPAMASSPDTTVVMSKPDVKGEVVSRLREILQIRERAIRERDPSLFDEIYTSNCSCLSAGRAAIAALKREHVQWTNRSISIEIQSTRQISDRLWEIVALFVSDPFRIETEEGRLVREAPGERIRYRFLLVQMPDAGPWRLGGASPVEG
jgi:hypothetical protein